MVVKSLFKATFREPMYDYLLLLVSSMAWDTTLSVKQLPFKGQVLLLRQLCFLVEVSATSTSVAFILWF